jgi:hypothetical protein
MKRSMIGAVIASLAVAGTAGPVAAKTGGRSAPKPPKRHHVLWAKLGPVAVGPYGMVPATRGQARLGDGRKQDKLQIHVRGLQPGATYAWHIHQASAGGTDPCAAPAADAAPVAGWIFGSLTANAEGNANAQGRSFTFTADPAATYYVDVHLPGGAALVCGVLHGKPEQLRPAKPKRGKGKGQTAPAPMVPTANDTAGDPPAGQDPFVVDAPPGGSPDASGGSTSPTPVTGDQDDQSNDDGDRSSGRSGRRGHWKKAHPRHQWPQGDSER